MNNEKYNQIIDEVYEKYLGYTITGIQCGFDKIKGYLDGCLVDYDGCYEHFTNPSFAYGYRTHEKEEFINKCKTDSEFSEKWGLKIEERELTTVQERKKYDNYFDDLIGEYLEHHETLDKRGVPRKITTLTYKNETVITYE